MAHGRLVADGQPIASYDDELAAALRTTTRQAVAGRAAVGLTQRVAAARAARSFAASPWAGCSQSVGLAE